jgi:hypothetical protein
MYVRRRTEPSLGSGDRAVRREYKFGYPARSNRLAPTRRINRNGSWIARGLLYAADVEPFVTLTRASVLQRCLPRTMSSQMSLYAQLL